MPEHQLPESSIPLRQRMMNLILSYAHGCTWAELHTDLEVALSVRYLEPA